MAIADRNEAKKLQALLYRHGLDVVEEAIASAKASNNGKPKFIKCNTIIGWVWKRLRWSGTAINGVGIICVMI